MLNDDFYTKVLLNLININLQKVVLLLGDGKKNLEAKNSKNLDFLLKQEQRVLKSFSKQKKSQDEFVKNPLEYIFKTTK